LLKLSSYTEYEKFEIAKRHLLDKQLIYMDWQELSSP
jgi:ATP-dependent Lon protease